MVSRTGEVADGGGFTGGVWSYGWQFEYVGREEYEGRCSSLDRLSGSTHGIGSQPLTVS